MSGTTRPGWVLTLLTFLGAGPAAAQHLSLSPTIGIYIPTTELTKLVNGQEFKQEVGLAVGGRLGLTFSPRFGVLGSVSYVPSDLRFTANQTETKTNANLLFSSLRATLYLIPLTSPLWVNVNGGGSLVHRSGTGFENAEDRTDAGGVVGATAGVHLGSLLSFYLAADDYIYGTNLDQTLGGEKKTQNDVHLSLGLGIPLGER